MPKPKPRLTICAMAITAKVGANASPMKQPIVMIGNTAMAKPTPR